MQPNQFTISELFESKRRYVVPLYQRQYVWNLEKQWEPLWDDLQRKFDSKITDNGGPPHFLGAMVFEQKRYYGKEVP